MLTKNFYSIQGILIFRSGTFPVTKADGTKGNIVFYHSNSYYPYAFDSGYLSNNISQGAINIGSGTTPATVNDYTLEAQIKSGFTSSITRFVRAQDNGVENVYKLIITNSSDTEPMIVSEIGYYGRGYLSSSSSNSIPLLIDRTLLNEPVTIPAGESRTITYTVRLNQPS